MQQVFLVLAIVALAKTKANPIEDTNGKDIYKALLASAEVNLLGRHVRQAVKVPSEAKYAPLAKTFFDAPEAYALPPVAANSFFVAPDTMEQKARNPAMYYNSKKLSRQARQTIDFPAPAPAPPPAPALVPPPAFALAPALAPAPEAEAEVEVPAPEAPAQKARIPEMYYNSKKLSRQARQAEEVPAPEAEAEVPAPEAEVAVPEAQTLYACHNRLG